MENTIIRRNKARNSTVMRVRKRIKGTAERPRLAVCKTNRHISAQMIDDDAGVTLVSAGDFTKGKNATVEAAKVVGQDIAAKAMKLNIKSVVFDRRYRQYHGCVKALADAAREAGLLF